MQGSYIFMVYVSDQCILFDLKNSNLICYSTGMTDPDFWKINKGKITQLWAIRKFYCELIVSMIYVIFYSARHCIESCFFCSCPKVISFVLFCIILPLGILLHRYIIVPSFYSYKINIVNVIVICFL